MRTLRVAIGILLIGVWVCGSLMVWISAELMSIDEEWQGWGDVLLNPYIVVAYTVASAALLIPAVVLLRHGSRRSA